jgi:ABC-type Fe3+-hydroxamate transport system substrate-binding protein
MKHHVTSTPVLVLALLLSACATEGEQTTKPTTSSSGVITEERTGASATGDAAATVTVSAMTARVEAIDLATRMVTLVRPDGKSVVVQAGEPVRNLPQVKVGDKVTVEYYEGLAAEIAPKGTSPSDVKATDVLARAPLGERPAGAYGEAIAATVVIEYVDTLRNVVHFTGPLGKTRVVKVMKPEFRAMLKNLKPGDQVTLTYFEALAVSVKPASN